MEQDNEQIKLHLVDTDTGEAHGTAYNSLDFTELVKLNDRKERELNILRLKCGRLEKELRDKHGQEPIAEDVEEVLTYWRPRCMPKARIILGSPRWNKVRDRLREVDVVSGDSLTVVECFEAIEGALLSDFHRDNSYLDAVTIFRDASTVDKHRQRFNGGMASSRRQAILDLAEIPVPDLLQLIAPCDCGHRMFQHRPANAQGLTFCTRCDCTDFDRTEQKLERWRESA